MSRNRREGYFAGVSSSKVFRYYFDGRKLRSFSTVPLNRKQRKLQQMYNGIRIKDLL